MQTKSDLQPLRMDVIEKNDILYLAQTSFSIVILKERRGVQNSFFEDNRDL